MEVDISSHAHQETKKVRSLPIRDITSIDEIYLDNGYIDIPKILSTGYPFIFIIGGRGTGKTFNSLTYPIDYDVKFIYMRRTQTQCDIVRSKDLCPYKKVNSVRNWDITPAPCGKQMSGLYHLDEKGKTFGDALGYMCALSTFSNLRGFDASDVDLLIFDEFIPEPTERPIKEEAEGFLNAVETIARNRELDGNPPLQCLLLANANYLGNPLFLELGLISKVDKMAQTKDVEMLKLPKRGILIIKFKDSEITEAKKQTALYRMVGRKSSFYNMAIENSFSKEERSEEKSVNLRQLRPVVNVGELAIYEYKSEEKYYVTTHKSGSPEAEFGDGSIERKRFMSQYRYLYKAYMLDQMVFESYVCEILWTKYFEIK